MRYRSIHFWVATTTVLLAGLSAQAQTAEPRYRVQELTALSQARATGYETTPVAMNNLGQVTGGSDFGIPSPNGWVTPFLYSNGRLQGVPGLGDAVFGYGADINDRGNVVGNYFTAGNRQRRAYLSRDGQLIDLGAGLQRREAAAEAVNQHGHVTGNIDGQAFLYDGQSTRVLLDGGQPLGYASRGTGINDRGDVVGIVAPSADVPGYNGFVYSAAGQVTRVSAPGAIYTELLDINNAGQAVGYAESIGMTRAYVWDNGTLSELDGLGGTMTFATEINAEGWIVGTAYDAEDNPWATLWHDGSLYKLNDLLAPNAAQRWSVDGVYTITDTGQILGVGRVGPQQRIGFVVLTPVPEPVSLVLLLAGLGVVTAVARSRHFSCG